MCIYIYIYIYTYLISLSLSIYIYIYIHISRSTGRLKSRAPTRPRRAPNAPLSNKTCNFRACVEGPACGLDLFSRDVANFRFRALREQKWHARRSRCLVPPGSVKRPNVVVS